MYKLFLTLRYLTRKAIVIFPILVVWLCVMMLIIVTSIMGGFVERVQTANRELLGDIVIYSNAGYGWPYYAEFQQELKSLDEVEDSTPVVYSYGIINLADYHSQRPAQIIGIDPAGHARVSHFRGTLFRQSAAPRAAVDDLAATGLPATGKELAARADLRLQAADDETTTAYRNWKAARDALPPPRVFNPWWWSLGIIPTILITIALGSLTWRKGGLWPALVIIVPLTCLVAIVIPIAKPLLHRPLDQRSAEYYNDRLDQARVRAERAARALDYALQPDPKTLSPRHLDPAKTYRTPAELAAVLVPPEPNFTPPPQLTPPFPGARIKPPKEGCIVGVDLARDLGLYERDRRGDYLRDPRLDDTRAVVTIVPIGARGSLLQNQTSSRDFTIVDDSYSRVIDVDSTYVYAPFDTVQQMAWMSNPDDPTDPKRCSQLEIKIKNADDPRALYLARDKIERKLDEFRQTHPGMDFLRIETWDQKQARYIGAVKNEKTMITFVLLLMSVVVLVVIFLIFYMIVRDKTRDIGIIKALGGTEEGVIAIFASYGLFIGAVGGLLGMVTGVLFVFHTNDIHELIFQATGITIWDRSIYLFDRIPDTVNWTEVSIYVGVAVLSGLIGAIIPAIIAGNQDPVKAVRSE